MGYRPHLIKTYIVEYGKILNCENWDTQDFIDFLYAADISACHESFEDTDKIYINTNTLLSIPLEKRVKDFKKAYPKADLNLPLEEYIENIKDLYEATQLPDIKRREEIIIEWF
jgi:hypothetical protein